MQTKPFFVLTWFLFLSALSAWAQDVGSTEKEVLAAYGQPQLQREGSKGTVWSYSNGTRLVISKGVVIETNISTTQAPPTKSEIKSTYTTRTEEQAKPARVSTKTDDRQPHLEFSPLAVVLLILGILISLAASIWFIVVTFQASMAWGFCCMFLPLTSVVFLFVHWDVSKKPLLLCFHSLQ